MSAITTPGTQPTGLGGGLGGRRRRWGQRLLGAALAIGAVLFLISLGLSALRERRAERDAFPVEDGTVRVTGIERLVEISRDARGTPHVEAESEADALFGLGFVHAQDRLSQMVWLARSARGRAAELVGKDALAADRLARTLGLGELADAQVARLDASTRAALVAYSAGVNAWMDEIRGGRAGAPLALERAGVGLEPWTPGDCIAIVKLYAWVLGNSLEASVLYSDLIERLGGFEAHFFFPDPPGGDGVAPSQEALAPPAPSWVATAPPARRQEDPLGLAAGLAGRGAGSSAWVVSGHLSRSGKPLLAADAHLEATAPGLFYEAHFRGGALDVAGGTIPGVPVVWSGANRHVAWGATSAGAVTTDLFVETLDATGTRYHDGDAFTRLRVRKEAIRIRGASEEALVVRETRHGPLVNALLPGEHEPLAVAWTGARAGDGIGSMLRAAKATNTAQFRAALAGHHEPVLAIVFADADGAAGFQVAGYVPHRGLATNLAPVPGHTDLYDWKGALPLEALPQASLPAGGNWLIAADAPLSRSGVRGEWFWREGNRQRRIDGLLREAQRRGPMEVRDLAEMQADVGSPEQRQLIATALALAGDPSTLGAEAREVAQVLASWDGRASADSVGAALSHVFVERLVQGLLGERLGPDLLERYLASPRTSPVYVLAQILNQARARAPAARGRGGAASDSIVDAIRRSLRESWLFLSVHAGSNREKWAWGRLHTVTFRPLGLAARLGARGDALGPFPCDGDEATVAAAEYDHRQPFEVRLASTYRFAVDTAQLDQALSALVPGESEHPGHPHETDGIARWREGRPRLLGTSRLLIDETSRTRLSLEPASRPQ